MKRKLTAILLTLATITMLLTSCGSKNAEEQSTTPSTTEETVVQTTEAEQTTAAAPEATKAAATQAAKQPAAPKTTAEIVSYYNDSVNRVKKEATSLTRNYKKMKSLPEYLELPSAIESIGKAAIEQFVKGSDTPETWTSKEDIKTVFPVGGTEYSSHLTVDMVESATCSDKGSTYQIELKLYNDAKTSPAKGEGYAGVFNTVTASTFSDINIPTVTFKSVKVNGIGGSVSCTVDKETGRVTAITFRNTDILDMDVKVAFSDTHAKFALSAEENYTIKY